MPLDPSVERFLARFREPDGRVWTIGELRRLTELRSPVERRALPHVGDLDVPGPGGAVPVRLYRPVPRAAGPLPALVYLHGGGWVLGGIESVDAACRDLAAETGCAVLNVGYRLAPEHPFPAAVEDAWAVVEDLARRPGRFGARPHAIAVAGDSAGGNLAAVVALLARDRGVRLVHQLLVYPVTDTSGDTASWAAYGEGYGLDASTLRRFAALYRADADPADPRLAPLRAPDLSGLAPATVITADHDILRDEGEAYARRLAAAGVPVAGRRYPGTIHSFFLLPDMFEAGVEARAFAVRRLRAAFGTAPPDARPGTSAQADADDRTGQRGEDSAA
ncbi:alpha/beta hydrolase [Actinomadura harenae]|uniref:Alpha/beta hydrolase n=1 Tax=Actinomadura harenae TaxID=2483351 RepID=A0A3M2LRZ8_9ACTN|nr:alpha/beta hydrolase [Actinomadura harenae]RMI37638.1 alpha/beta hydrolase [Actinomadura harenae]